MASEPKNHYSLTRYAWLSVFAALLTIGLKTTAYFLTNSVGLLSDAMESLVNLVGALMALSMLTIAARPPDEDHPYGHSKAEYFSSGLEGSLIVIAAVSIGYAAVERLIYPRPLEQIGLGLAVSVVASIINLGVAMILLKAARQYESITLKANANHLFTDVWTSAGVLIGVGAAVLTGWNPLDPIVAIIVAGNIIWTGFRIVRQSIHGLMDTAWQPDEQKQLRELLQPYVESGIEYHALRTRQAGARRFVSMHVLVPGEWSVERGHHLLEHIEGQIRDTFPNVTVFTHLEPLEDPVSWKDVNLDRGETD